MIRVLSHSTPRRARLLQRLAYSIRQPAVSNEMRSNGNEWKVAKVLALATAAGCANMMVSTCDNELSENPLWPQGVMKDDVNEFVDSILGDDSMNMSGIPDVVERQIYVTTVTLTANVLYKALSQVHGVSLFGHKLQLLREASKRWNGTGKEHIGIDEKILEQVADRLLANSSINQTLIPDFLERQLYFNCLRIIFHLLDTIAASFCVTICGHDVRLHFEPTSKITKPVSSQTEVDIAKLVEYAKQDLGDDRKGLYGELQAQLTASVYGLVLGILDDMLANIDIEILSDRIAIDVIPNSGETKVGATKKSSVPVLSKKKTQIDRSTQKMLASFTLGVAIGAIAVIKTGTN
mmetsp:Transcript_17056/g.25861  ORF Transcript_17056/g.25861 Transcript_17056/m.25861 type:complete len:350 (-) Transcript_17056:30-1079(-)